MDRVGDLAVFVQVVASGSFTAAADRLAIAKSVVSKTVSRLEERLGARLLHRTTRRLSLTEAGERLYERASRALREIDEAERDASRLQDSPRGVLRVTVPMSFGLLHVAPALPAFLERHPQVSVDLRLDDRRLDVVGGGIDVALRIGALPDSSLVAKRLATVRMHTVASPAYLERYGTPRHPEELRTHRCLRFAHRQPAGVWHFREPGGRDLAIAVDGPLHANNGLALREALLAGIGIHHAPDFTIGEDVRKGRVVAILEAFRGPDLPVHAVLPERRHVAPKVRAFIDFFAERFEANPWDVGDTSPRPARRGR